MFSMTLPLGYVAAAVAFLLVFAMVLGVKLWLGRLYAKLAVLDQFFFAKPAPSWPSKVTTGADFVVRSSTQMPQAPGKRVVCVTSRPSRTPTARTTASTTISRPEQRLPGQASRA